MMGDESTTMSSLGPLPPDALRERVAGTSDANWFDESGARTVEEWRRALVVTGNRFSDFGTILDFGCGCGRALRHLEADLLPTQRLIGLDVDVQAIAWLTASYPRVTSLPLTAAPPTSLAAGSVDLVLAHSVFTHLPEDVQFLWLGELSRLLRQDGILVASVHGAKVIREYRHALQSQERHNEAGSFDAAIHLKGFYHVQGRTTAEMALPEYYGAAFHDIRYVVDHWLQAFVLLAWLPTFALGHQDVVVLRRKAD